MGSGKVKIVIAGKGGVGKTTLAGTLAKILEEQGFEVLAVDGDPSMNLHTSLGLENPTPISELKELITKRTVVASGIYNLSPKVDDIPENYSAKKGKLKLIVMGTIEKGGEGCICPENAFLRALLRHLVLKRNEVLILDTEAGVEHLGRKTAEKFDLMLVLVEPSAKAVEVANRIQELAKQIGIKRVLAVGNKIASKEQEKFLSENLGMEILGTIPFDDAVQRCDMAGKPLSESRDSKALGAIKEIAARVKALLK